jgi:osmotically-inducible protein OsmY
MQQQQFANQGQQGNQQTQTMKVRPQLRVAFKHKAPVPATIESKIQTRVDKMKPRFEKLKESWQFDDVDFDVEGSTVTLRGAVDTEDAKKLAALLAQMEQGVRKVDNRLTVRNPPAPAAEE